VVVSLSADEVFRAIAQAAWETGDPGLVFLDEINRHQPTPEVGEIEATNPCGEQPLLAHKACTLASINVSRLVREGSFDWERLTELVHLGVNFLDNVLDINHYPFPEIAQQTKANRKIGLGVMGFAEALIQLGIPYESEETLEFARKLMKHVSEEAHHASRELAKVRGAFPNFKGSRWSLSGSEAIRNATVTTIAPTGTIGIIAGTSSGIEPLFAVTYFRRILEGKELLEVNPFFEEVLKARGVYSKELIQHVSESGRVSSAQAIPEDLEKLFQTALDVSPRFHVKVQAVFQEFTDNAVSKTINLSEKVSPEEIMQAFLFAHELKCKGITVYRYGSKAHQVLNLGLPREKKEGERRASLTVGPEYTGECRVCSV